MVEDIPDDVRLLTYAELGELLGIEPESAKRRAVRHGWRRVPGNKGRTLVVVPTTVLPERPLVPGTAAAPDDERPVDVLWNGPGDGQGDSAARPGDIGLLSQVLADLRAALRTAERRQAEADERAGRGEARADAAQGLADRRGEELGELRERAGRAEGESATLREQLTTERSRLEAATCELEAARSELAAWTAGGPLARAVRAFLNRRGR